AGLIGADISVPRTSSQQMENDSCLRGAGRLPLRCRSMPVRIYSISGFGGIGHAEFIVTSEPAISVKHESSESPDHTLLVRGSGSDPKCLSGGRSDAGAGQFCERFLMLARVARPRIANLGHN